jgi:hypothetical protein
MQKFAQRYFQLTSLFIFLFSFISENLKAQGASSDFKARVYYLAIGSYHYSLKFYEFDSGFNGFTQIPSIEKSARYLSTLLNSIGAQGMLIESTSKNYVTKDTVLNTLRKLVTKIDTNDHQSNPPILFIYFIGHGISDKYLEQLFLIPGDFNLNYRNPYRADSIRKIAISHADIKNCISSYLSFIKVILLLDCCYGKELENLRWFRYDSLARAQVHPAGGPSYPDNFDPKHALSKSAYDLRNSYFPLIAFFASGPGGYVELVSAPNSSNELDAIGPLCRRLGLVFKKNQGRKMYLYELAKNLMDKDLDRETSIPFSLFESVLYNYRIYITIPID